MKKVHLHNKTFRSEDLNQLIIGGQNNADTIRFVVPKVFAGEIDLSSWDWFVQYRNKNGEGDMVSLSSMQSEESTLNLWIDWKPGASATAVSGKLSIQVFATKEQQKITFVPFAVYVEEWLSPEPFIPDNPTIIEQALELMEFYASNVEEALKQGQLAEYYAQSAADSAERSISAKDESEQFALTASNMAQAAEEAKKKTEELSSAFEVYLNKNEITASLDNIQSVCTNYVLSNYSRQPKNYDVLIVSLNDTETSYKYRYSEESKTWIKFGRSDISSTTATSEYAGIMKLYDEVGENIDGTVTQKVIKGHADFINRYRKAVSVNNKIVGISRPIETHEVSELVNESGNIYGATFKVDENQSTSYAYTGFILFDVASSISINKRKIRVFLKTNTLNSIAIVFSNISSWGTTSNAITQSFALEEGAEEYFFDFDLSEDKYSTLISDSRPIFLLIGKTGSGAISKDGNIEFTYSAYIFNDELETEKESYLFADDSKHALNADKALVAEGLVNMDMNIGVSFDDTDNYYVYAHGIDKNTLIDRNKFRVDALETTTDSNWHFLILSYKINISSVDDPIKNKKIVYYINSDISLARLGIGNNRSQWCRIDFSNKAYKKVIFTDKTIGEMLSESDYFGSDFIGTIYVTMGFDFSNISPNEDGTYTSPAFFAELNLGMIDAEEEGKAFVKANILGNKSANDFYTKSEINDLFETPEKYITCWGDSLTAGGGWTTRLKELSGMPVYNGGTGGENSKIIMARQGGDVMIINDITIPSDVTPVLIASRATDSGISTELGNKVTPLLQGGAHVNPCMIGEVKGTLAWTGNGYADTNGTWTFTRAEAGEELIITRPTAIRTDFDINRNSPHLMVIFMGQNGGYIDLDDLVRQHRLMIEHSKAKYVIVLGLSSGTAESRKEYEDKMRDEFGRYFISLREYLSHPIYDGETIVSCYGLDDAGLSATDDDLEKIAIGQVPSQLLSDSVHYTSVTKTVLGNMIYKKCIDLNIF